MIKCPNCGDDVPGTYYHSCGKYYLDVEHCGCFYEAPPTAKETMYHDCYCEDLVAK